MRAAMKQDPGGQKLKGERVRETVRGRDRQRERENGGNSTRPCSVSNQLDMCDLCLRLHWKPHTPVSTNGVVGSGRQEVGGTSQKGKKEEEKQMKNKVS